MSFPGAGRPAGSERSWPTAPRSVGGQPPGDPPRFSAWCERSLHFWLHFVTMPVQVGAAISPQAMQNPLRVEWDAP